MDQVREKRGTHLNQWVWLVEERKLAMKRDPQIAVSQKSFNRRYFLWDRPEERDPAGHIIRSFYQQADIRTFFPEEVSGIILRNGKRCLNTPVLQHRY